MSGKRANGEGSIFPYKNGWAAYVWVTTPEGLKARKWLYGKSREEIYDPWLQLKAKAAKMPIPTSTPSVAEYLAYWLEEVIKPNREDNTYSHYELMSRLHIIPGIGKKRIDKLTVRETQAWINQLPGKCQCCAQGKDAARRKPKCCAIGECCEDYPSRRVIEAADAHWRVRTNRTDTDGKLTLRISGRLHHIGIGRDHARTPVLMLTRDLNVRVINAATGELIRELVIDPARNYQPTGRPPGPPPATPRPPRRETKTPNPS